MSLISRLLFETEIVIPGPVGGLQALVGEPEAIVTEGGGIAVICHPNPAESGTMMNKVVTTLTRTLSEWGMKTVRFNYRGVCGSDGDSEASEAEVADVLAVVDWMMDRYPGERLTLAGFSFGTYMSAMAATQRPTACLINVAPVIDRKDFSPVETLDAPWVVVMGDDDEIVPAKAVYDWIEQSSKTPTLIRFPGTGHFFHGKLTALRERLKEALDDVI